MQRIRSFRDLEVWQVAMDLALAAQTLADQLPQTQRFELAAQMRRAATSVPSNIAEGHAYRSDRVFLRHVRIAFGSLAELATQIELAARLDYITREVELAIRADIDRTGKLLHGLRRTLATSVQQTIVKSLTVAAIGGGLLSLLMPA